MGLFYMRAVNDLDGLVDVYLSTIGNRLSGVSQGMISLVGHKTGAFGILAGITVLAGSTWSYIGGVNGYAIIPVALVMAFLVVKPFEDTSFDDATQQQKFIAVNAAAITAIINGVQLVMNFGDGTNLTNLLAITLAVVAPLFALVPKPELQFAKTS